MDTAPTLPEPDLLERLVTLIDGSVAGNGWHRNHILVKVERVDNPDLDDPDPDAFELGFKELPEGSQPVDELWGFRAPDSWIAAGVVSYGWCGPLGSRPSLHPDRQRVRLTTLMDRTGREACTAALEDGTVIDEPGEGRMRDVLLLVMGLPTDPPPPIELLAETIWLNRVVEESETRRVSWNRIVTLRERPTGRASTWAGARQMAAETGRWPGVLDWMDDGFFARELLSRMASIDEMVDVLSTRLSPGVLRKLRAALRE